MTLKILLADEHEVTRQGVRLLLTAQGVASEVGEVATGAEAIASAANGRWHIALLDISLPDMNGIDALRQIRRKADRMPVLMFSMQREDQYAMRSLKAGASGYLSKTCTVATLMSAVRQVAAGRRYLSPEMAEALVSHVVEGDSEQLPHEKLSDREYQTLCMLGAGKRLSDVADALCLSVKTVSVYRTRLLEKMRLSNNAELTHYVIRNGLAEV
jgi:two-component system invasion response regulator UvrY